MLGLELTTVGLLHMAGMSPYERARQQTYEKAKQEAIAKITCDPVAPLDIKIDPDQTPIKYDFAKTIDQIGVIGKGAYSPYGHEHKTHTLGLAVGKQRLAYEIGYSSQVYEELDRACVHIRNITVTIDYSPTIYVAAEHPKGTCEFNAILEHELAHVKITQKMLNKYSKILGNHLQQSLKGGYSFGPFKASSVEKAQEMLQSKIEKITLKINDDMNKEHEKRQNRFDDNDKGKVTRVCEKQG